MLISISIFILFYFIFPRFSVAESTWGDTHENHPRFRLIFSKGKYSYGYGGYAENSDFFDISYVDLLIDVISK